MAIDINELWDYAKPEVSEARFQQALVGASADDSLILQTQIARTFGLRKQFDQARRILAAIEPRIANASPEVRTRYLLELGRTYASPVHPAADVTQETREIARAHYMRAFQTASDAGLDGLAIDALHMMPLVDTDPALQLEWNQKAIASMEKSSQPAAKRWEPVLRNNVGYAKHLAGDYDEALRQFRLSLAAHERAGNVRAIRIAHWMIAWTYRAQQRYTDAIEVQLRLEREWDAAGDPDPYVFEELEHLYRAIGDREKAGHYRDRHTALKAR
ncbi:MAG: tetratricopeptide repeat protein [Ramlibacter sp.]|nr:tetratricopeptide repeat protein [Ramlibacter sp.]